MTPPRTELNNDLADAVRELEKAHDVLQSCNDYFQSQGLMNASLHMSDRVIPNPLASAVLTQLSGLNRSIKGFQRVLNGEEQLPMDYESPAVHYIGKGRPPLEDHTDPDQYVTFGSDDPDPEDV